MPPLPVVPQVCKLVISGTYHDAKWINIYYVHYTGSAPAATDIYNYLTAIDSHVGTAYGAEMSVDNEVTLYEMTDLTSATGASNSFTVSHFGVRTGDFMPAGVAMVASFEINRRYRGGHPRKYLPWGTAGTMASGSTIDWDSAFVTDCQSKLTAMLGSGQLIGQTEGGTTWDEIVNVSYRNAGAVRATAVVDTVVNTIVRPRICSQRRRLGKVGG